MTLHGRPVAFYSDRHSLETVADALCLRLRGGGLPALSPLVALMASVVLGIPAAWLSGQWIRHLLDEAAKS